MNRTKHLLIALALATAPFAAACGDGTSSEGEGKISVQLTDAPGDNITAAIVTITQIYLQGDSGRVVLSDDVFVTDLVSLHNDTQLLVTDAVVPNGRYHQLRFVITGAYVEVVENGQAVVYATPDYAEVPVTANVVGELKTPSWDASGLKIKLPNDRVDVVGDQRIYVVDFDVAESFQTATGNGDWVLRPNLTATEIGFTGTIDVGVSLAAGVVATPAMLADIEVVLSDAEGNFEGALPLADLDSDGDYEASFRFVTPTEGPFTVWLRGPADATLQVVGDGQTVALDSGAHADAAFEIEVLVLP